MKEVKLRHKSHLVRGLDVLYLWLILKCGVLFSQKVSNARADTAKTTFLYTLYIFVKNSKVA